MQQRVLIVDDNEGSLDTFRDYLKMLGYEALTATNGLEAWGHLDRGTKVDLVITDMTMPEMTGLELLRRMREDRRTREIPVGLISGDDFVSEHDKTPLKDVVEDFGGIFRRRLDLDIEELLSTLSQARGVK